jgi:hypothetical protein
MLQAILLAENQCFSADVAKLLRIIVILKANAVWQRCHGWGSGFDNVQQ